MNRIQPIHLNHKRPFRLANIKKVGNEEHHDDVNQIVIRLRKTSLRPKLEGCSRDTQGFN